MSLITTASQWNSSDSISTSSNSKKRVPMMKNAIKNLPYENSFNPEQNIQNNYSSSHIENYQNLQPSSIEHSQTINENRNMKVQDLLNKMNVDNTGDRLANFNPPPSPILNIKKPDISAKSNVGEFNPSELLPKNDFSNSSPPNFKQSTQNNSYIAPYTFSAPANNLGNYGNYKNAYDPTNIAPKPYYAKMGIGASGLSQSGGLADDKLMEKINYMIHLLEEQQNEKTHHITEEFVLYTFLGIFMIYIVDSFSRAGKYVR